MKEKIFHKIMTEARHVLQSLTYVSMNIDVTNSHEYNNVPHQKTNSSTLWTHKKCITAI